MNEIRRKWCVSFFALALHLSAMEWIRAADAPDPEVQKAQEAATATRQAAATSPTVTDANSAPVKAYLAEQQLRRISRLSGLRQRIAAAKENVSRDSLLPVLEGQLKDLESRPAETVSFDAAYRYSPSTGLLGYSKKVRFLENRPGGKAVILVDGTALELEGLGTSSYASGKFFGVDKAILVGEKGADFMFQGTPRKLFAAKLVDLDGVLNKK